MTNKYNNGPKLGLTVPYGNGITIPSEKDLKEMKSVHEVCREFGISRKTLYYYDKIGILKPTYRHGKQNAKLYSKKACKRLEDILLYQKAGLTLNTIQTLLDDKNVNPVAILKNSIHVMQKQQEELDEKISSKEFYKLPLYEDMLFH